MSGSKDQNPAIEVDSHAQPLNYILFEGFQKGEPKGNTYSKRSNISPKAHFSSALFLPFQRVQSLSQAPRSNKIRYLLLTPKNVWGHFESFPKESDGAKKRVEAPLLAHPASSFMGQMVVFTQNALFTYRGMVFITHPSPVKQKKRSASREDSGWCRNWSSSPVSSVFRTHN